MRSRADIAVIYVMATAKPGILKIGHSGDVPRRSQELGGHDVLYVSSPMRFAERIEHVAHKLMQPRRIGAHGERYRSSLEDACEAIDRAIRIDAGIEPMPSNKTKQVNVRLDRAHVEMLVWLQRNAKADDASYVPSVNAVVADAIREMWRREHDGDKRAARR